MTQRRYPFTLRSLAALAALSVAAAGGGVPMCVSLIARATAPCTMHTEHAGAPAHHVATASVHAAPSDDGSCHADSQSWGCATGGLCPTGGTASLVLLGYPPISGAPTHGVAFQVAARHPSFDAPPLAPPPQA